MTKPRAIAPPPPADMETSPEACVAIIFWYFSQITSRLWAYDDPPLFQIHGPHLPITIRFRFIDHVFHCVGGGFVARI